MKTFTAAISLSMALFMSISLYGQSKSFSVNEPQLSVSKSNDGIDILWTTQREINSSYFLIETSSDSIHFTTLKKISASGSPLFGSRYEDEENANQSTQYIRITLVDMNGVKYCSSISKIPGIGSLTAHSN